MNVVFFLINFKLKLCKVSVLDYNIHITFNLAGAVIRTNLDWALLVIDNNGVDAVTVSLIIK